MRRAPFLVASAATLTWALAAALPAATLAADVPPSVAPLLPPPPPPPAASGPNGAGAGAPAGQPSPMPLGAPAPPAAVQTPAPLTIIGQSSASAPPVPAALEEPPPALLGTDVLGDPGYVPGYRTYQSLSLSPYAPNAIALPGGVTPGYGAPMPLEQWTFRWNGTVSTSLQESIGQRAMAAPGQGTTIFNAPPRTVDEYGSFLGTSTMPGQWAALNFSYAKQLVSVNLSLSTWNPTAPTTYYQIGSQLFFNNLNLQYDLPAMSSGLKLRAQIGFFPSYYGGLGQYGPGMYTNHMVGLVRGIGEMVSAEFPLGHSYTLLFEEGFVGNRNGKVPSGVIPTGSNGGNNPIFPASWVHHFHLGILRVGEPTFRITAHYLANWARDDRTQMFADNPVTKAIDESHPFDGSIQVLGLDAMVNSRTWGHLAAAGSYVKGDNAYTLKGLATYGNEGQTLTDRWWGPASKGTGKLFVAGANYSVSLGRILTRPAAFTGDRPDVVINAGVVVAYTLTSTAALQGTTLPPGAVAPGPLPGDVDIFNHRLRYKFGTDVLYTFLSYLGAGARIDRVAPNSKDAGETFHVLAARLVWKSNWSSRDTITLLYGKWFYGSRTHPEASAILPSDIGRLDDQLVAINANLSW